MTDAGETKRVAAEAKLGALLDNPDVVLKVQSDGGVKVTDASLPKRIWKSWTVRIQAATGIAAAVYIMVPQDVILGVVPPEYLAKALLAHTVVTAFVKIRNV